MKLSYKKLGEYIRVVNIRNKDLKVKKLLGVSIRKVFIESIANTIGTNMKTYKVIKRNQFGYGPVTSRNGDKISIALLEDYDEAIISQAYTVFEVIDTNKLLPEYLMMWFRRPEFDRYARYKSHGSTREIFNWNEMKETELPVPSIEKQQQVVDEYNIIIDRIKLNEKLNQKLEETAQAIYKEWFVDFEFPMTKEDATTLGDPSLEGKPYKSSGGKMVYNEVLDRDIPEGWRDGNLTQIANYLNGLAMQKYESFNENYLPVIKIRELNQGYPDTNSGKALLTIPEEYIIKDGDIIFSWSATLKVEIWCGGYGGLNQHLFKVTSDKYPKWFFYLWTKIHLNKFNRIADGKKTSMGHIKREDLSNSLVLIPTENYLISMNKIMNVLIENIILVKSENIKLQQLKEILLSKMARG